MKSSKNIKSLVLFNTIIFNFVFCTCPVGDCYAQSRVIGAKRFLPLYNMWMPSISNYQKTIEQPYRNQYKIKETDSLFYWQVVYTEVPYALTDIFFIDSLYGWISHGNGGVLRTTDSGFNWDTVQLINGGPVEGVNFINRDIGWAVGILSLIRKTTNGGINWISQDWPYYTGYYYSVHFFDTNTGIVTGKRDTMGYYRGFIIKTFDGGLNWLELYLDTASETDLVNQFWFDSNNGWICGYDRLLKTTNGGNTFISYFSNIPPISNGHNGILTIYFINNDTGWLGAGNVDSKNIYKTTNGGNNWFYQNNPLNQAGSVTGGIIFINADTGWASNFFPYILETTNGGNNWFIDQYVGDENWYFAKYNSSKIWLTGAGGKLWFTLCKNPIGIINSSVQIPKTFKLFDNYPNPFNSSTIIEYELPEMSDVKIILYDILGNEIEKLVNKKQTAGKYKLSWDGSRYSSGIYFYRLVFDGGIISKKLVVLK